MIMSRNEFTVMKGFMEDLSVKTGETPECLPQDAGGDEGGEKLANKASGKGPKKGRYAMNADDLTMDKELGLVEDAASRDIKDGYVGDIQNPTVSNAKGFETYNSMVQKGMVADVSMNSHNVSESIGMINKSAEMVLKMTTPAGRKTDRKEQQVIRESRKKTSSPGESNKSRYEASKPITNAVADTGVAHGPKTELGSAVDDVGSALKARGSQGLKWVKGNPIKTAIAAGVPALGAAAYGGKKLYDKVTEGKKED
jgi:hypothetical protein